MTPQANPWKDIVAAVGGKLTFLHARTSSVTTAWGVNWNEEFISRDLWQNFFDANRHCLPQVSVTVEGHTVTISAPTPMELDRLFYLGSEKGDQDVGHYGEGFKVATVCLLRNHSVQPIVWSGDQVVAVRLDADTVSGTQLRPLVYDFYRTAAPFPGTKLILRGCSQKLVEALQTGLCHFLHEGNPLLSVRLWSSSDSHFAIYSTTTNDGHVFYQRLKRGTIPGIPVALVIGKPFAQIEKKTRQDRDRNAFGEELMKSFYHVFARSGLRHALDGQRAVIEAARPCWQRGHPLLSEIALASHWKLWPAKVSDSLFGSEFYACVHPRDAAQALQVEAIEKQWEKDGRKALPAYFSTFGVLNADDHVEELKRRALEEQKQRHQRATTRAEQDCLDLLHKIVRAYTPTLASTLQQNRAVYSVAETEVLLGQLQQHREYRSTSVFLSSQVFLKDFAEALAIFLHEHAHIFGYDGSRSFTDALTQLIETLVRHRLELDPFEQKWKALQTAVARERAQSAHVSDDHSVHELLRALTENQLRDLLKRLPEVALRRAMSNDGEN